MMMWNYASAEIHAPSCKFSMDTFENCDEKRQNRLERNREAARRYIALIQKPFEEEGMGGRIAKKRQGRGCN
jgi:hypothetical protein